jgi:hypothetical protein
MFSDPDQDNDGEAANDLPPIDDDDLSVPQPPLPQVPQQPPPVQHQPLPDVDMIQMMQMAGGPGYSVALNAADARMPDASRQVPSMRSGGESRRATLKRKAADITRSTSEIFARFIFDILSMTGWLDRIGSKMVYERRENKQVLYVVPVSSDCLWFQ